MKHDDSNSHDAQRFETNTRPCDDFLRASHYPGDNISEVRCLEKLNQRRFIAIRSFLQTQSNTSKKKKGKNKLRQSGSFRNCVVSMQYNFICWCGTKSSTGCKLVDLLLVGQRIIRVVGNKDASIWKLQFNFVSRWF